MRNVVLYHLQSLDGLALEDDSEWFTDSGPEMFANLARVIGTQDEILLGRRTYEYWSDYWPTSDVEPFATFVNSSPKHLFTSTDLTADWANTTVVSTPAVEYVANLKQQSGGDIGIHGSIDLASSLLRAGLVDVLELAVAPATAGDGRRVFNAADTAHGWDLADVGHSSHGTLFLTYRHAATTDAAASE